jgi:hypothetical protein
LMKPKLNITKVNKIEQNWTTFFTEYCLLTLHSVDNCRMM